MLHRIKPYLAKICLGVGILWAGGVAAFAGDDSFAEGQELYGEFCQNCHGPDKSGLDVFTGDMAALTERLEGLTDDMPDFTGFFEEEEIDALFAYLSEPE
jgi:mono/diheme cytochrome c family protein